MTHDAANRPWRRRLQSWTMAAELTDSRIRGWLGRALAGQRVTAARTLSGGYRNENILLVTADGQRYVLRRYLAEEAVTGSGAGPDGGLGAAGRTCAIEAALAARLRGTVPVAEVIAADPAGAAAGAPLLLSRYVPGTMVSELLARPAGPAAAAGADADADADADAGELGRAAGTALAAIGSVRFGSAGFFGGPDLVPSAAGMPASLPEFVDGCLRTANARRWPAGTGLTTAEQDGLRELAARSGPAADRAGAAGRLVHSDYNPKNLLAARRGGRWVISAVLDWEFAFSGSPLADIGNMLRPRPGAALAAFGTGFIAGYREAGGELPPGWRETSAALDLFALADFLTRPPDHRYSGRAIELIRDRLTRG
jgi:aminoglycoside phosphotransferase (APT) family kinase protein